MVRLKDIALRAGVSVMTVSKALRDAHDISGGTKLRIRQIAEQMGYVPNTSAQGLRNRSTKLFGLLISSPTNPIFSRIQMAIEERAHAQGYEVIIGHTLNDAGREEQYIRRLIARRVDGLFITPVYRLQPTAPIYDELLRYKIPTVLLGHRAPFCKTFASIETDDLGASALATRHLIELGHKRIAFLAGPTASPSSQERLDGYKRALKEAQIELDDQLIFNAGSTIEEGRKAALQMINEGVKFTAIQAANDLVAIGAAGTFLDQGVKIPQDVSVIGFGNVLTSEFFRVPLTTIRQPKFRLGLGAMDLMQQLLDGGAAEAKRIPAELAVRESTAIARP